MRLQFTLFLSVLLAALAFAQAPQKQVVVSYPKDTPQSILEEAMEAIKKAGGVITHEYSIIKGFAAKATENALETVKSLQGHDDVLIEEDQLVNAN